MLQSIKQYPRIFLAALLVLVLVAMMVAGCGTAVTDSNEVGEFDFEIMSGN